MRKNAILVVLMLLSGLIFSQEKYRLSSHILDIAKGLPAPNVEILLQKWNPQTQSWVFSDKKLTDANGRVKSFLKEEKGVDHKGIYKMTFYTAPYFEKQGVESFYPYIEVVFQINDQTHYHVPITLSPYGYSTYRGS